MVDFDIKIAIERYLPNAVYRLSSSVPPHEIVEWRSDFPIPLESRLAALYDEYLAEQGMKELAKQEKIAKIIEKGKIYEALLDGEVVELVLLEKI